METTGKAATEPAGPTADTQASPASRTKRSFHLPTRALLAFVVSIGTCILFIMHPVWGGMADTIKEVLIALTAVTGIHLLDRVMLFRDVDDGMNQMADVVALRSAQRHEKTQATIIGVTASKLEGVVAKLENMDRDVSGALTEYKDYLRKLSGSLEAMAAVGIDRLYGSRQEAGSDILRDLTEAQPVNIRLMGISLNDFVQGSGHFGRVWKVIKQRAVGTTGQRMVLRVLLIHPYCLGAQLRSKGEARGTDAIGSRLMTDVQAVAKEIEKLQEQARNISGVEIACRLYQLPPTLFLCSVDEVCYMQPYFFWNKRQDMPAPVMRFVKDANKKTQDDQIQHQLNEHFDLIWERASTSLDDFLQHSELGVDKGMRQAGAINVFLDRQESRRRILQMLRQAKKEVCVQGISLQSFFSGGDLFEEIIKLITGGKVRVRVLLIDPDCEQAKLRSFRERLFVNSREDLDTYLKLHRHEESALYKDTKETIAQIDGLILGLAAARARGWKHKLDARIYASAPACFVLKVDARVLVEQYHYGKAHKDDQPEMNFAILGKEMPVLEFKAEADDLYETPDEVAQRRPYRLLEDHFRFAFDQAKSCLSKQALDSLEDAEGSRTADATTANSAAQPVTPGPSHQPTSG